MSFPYVVSPSWVSFSHEDLGWVRYLSVCVSINVSTCVHIVRDSHKPVDQQPFVFVTHTYIYTYIKIYLHIFMCAVYTRINIYIYMYICLCVYIYMHIYMIYAINMQKTHSNTASQYNSSSFTGDTLRQGQQGLWTRPGWLVTWGSPISSGKTRLENHFDDKHLYGKQVGIKQGGWKTTFLQKAVICLCWSVVVVGWYLLNPQLRWLCLLWSQLSTWDWTNGMAVDSPES